MKHMITLAMVAAALVAAVPTPTLETPAEVEINDLCYRGQKAHFNLKLEDCKQPYLDCLKSDQYKQQNTPNPTDEQLKSLLEGVIQCKEKGDAKKALPQKDLKADNQIVARDLSSSFNKENKANQNDPIHFPGGAQGQKLPGSRENEDKANQNNAIHFLSGAQGQKPKGSQDNKDKEQQQVSQENKAKKQKDNGKENLAWKCESRYAAELGVNSGVCSDLFEQCSDGRKETKDLLPCAQDLAYEHTRASRLSKEARQRDKDGTSPPKGDYGFVPRPEDDVY